MLHAPLRTTRTVVLVSLLVMCLARPGAAQNWPRFRGPAGQGEGGTLLIPDSPSDADFNWRVKLPGRGQSSPVIWGQRIFTTCYDSQASECLLVCLAAGDGKQLWARSLPIESYGMHDLNSYASVTPALDSKHVVISWTSGRMLNLAAFGHDGEALWRKPLGASVANHGGGTSPTLFEGVVLIANDTERAAKSFVAGIDVETGDLLWKHARETSRASFASPLVHVPEQGPPQAIFASTSHGLTSLEPGTGKLIWERTDLFRPRCVASPALAGDILFATAGTGGGGKVGVALNLASRDESGAPEQQYELRHGLPYVPTPIATDDRLYLWADGGIVSCLELESGREIWRERVGGTFYGSPVLADGKLFAIDMSGELVWVRAADDFELLGRLDLGEASNSTPAVALGALYLRTETHLISVGGKPRASAGVSGD
ncbi:MAG: outer membrane protein assembly factor BamB [Chlamydiales bacterium]|jgi:outer membrane protein assembly factor BamB